MNLLVSGINCSTSEDELVEQVDIVDSSVLNGSTTASCSHSFPCSQPERCRFTHHYLTNLPDALFFYRSARCCAEDINSIILNAAHSFSPQISLFSLRLILPALLSFCALASLSFLFSLVVWVFHLFVSVCFSFITLFTLESVL